MNVMKPACIKSQIETRSAVLQQLRPENARALGFDRERYQEGFIGMR